MARPYWHVDLKWIFGVIAFTFLVPALFILGLYRLTAFSAVERLALGVAETVPADRGAVGWYLGEVEKRAAELPQEEVKLPILEARLSLTGEAVGKLTREELKAQIASDLVNGLYHEGFIEALSLNAPPEDRGDAFLRTLGFFTARSHRTLGALAAALFLTAGAFALLMMLFSAGLGKAMSLGFLLASATCPITFLLTFWELAARRGTSGGTLLGALAFNIALMARIYRVGWLAGVALFILGTLGSIALARSRKK